MTERPQSPPPLLDVRRLSVNRGLIPALHEIDLSLEAGELFCLLGANGAGKSSLLLSIAGLLPVRQGELLYHGARINTLSVDQRLRRGIALVPTGRGIFRQLSVAENLRLGAYSRRDRAAVSAEQAELFERLPRLRERLQQRAGTLSGGEQQLLALARALLARPRLLLLDEPSLGLAPAMVSEVYRFISEIRARGVAILLVEQNTRLALRHAERGCLLKAGRIILSGRRELLYDHPLLQRSAFDL